MGVVVAPVSKIEQLAYATVRIGTESGFGTGFLLEKRIDENNIMPLLITNKHVICKNDKQMEFVETGVLDFHCSDCNQNPVDEFVSYKYERNFGKSFIPHPNSNIDLCALNIAPFINYQKEIEKPVFVTYIPMNLVPKEEELMQLDYMEEIIMVGYPNALIDEVHKYPLIRKGITATHPYIDFNGKKEFLADITNIPGSSGSPVFLLKNNYMDKNGNTYLGSSLFYFMGISYAAPICPVLGNMEIVDIPTQLTLINNLKVSTNLAYVIKSSELYELINIIS